MTTPSEYEHGVATYFQRLGYQTRVTSYSNDYGLDVLAENGEERVAIQAKLYGHTKRHVNRQMVMELHGVKAYFDCDRAVLATDGTVREDAREVANKLGIEILTLSIDEPDDEFGRTPAKRESQAHRHTTSEATTELTFESIWMSHVMPLAGTTLAGSGNRTNRILTVDWAGIERITSNGRSSRIDIEIFRLTVNRLLSEGMITRDEINQNYAKRASSGVTLVLSQVPFFELQRSPTNRLVFHKPATT